MLASTALQAIASGTLLYFLSTYVLRKFLPKPASSPSSSPHRIYVAKTTHARIRPVGHAFSYPVLYIAVDLDHCNELPWGWVSYNAFGLFSIWDADFLVDDESGGRILRVEESVKWDTSKARSASVKQKLMSCLDDMGVDIKSVGKTVLVTTPRLLGYSFNPLNVYYCYHVDQPNTLLCAVLEVNNTFSERHVYLCDDRNKMEKTRAGYTSSHSITRSFHVSPFNNRSGNYEAHIAPLHENQFDVLLNLVKYENEDAKHLTARVFGTDVFGLSAYSVLYSWIHVGMLTVFLTVPRIMWQAWKLAYVRGLSVYGKPHPLSPTSKSSKTIIRQVPTTFECYAIERVFRHIESLDLHTAIRFHFPDSQNTVIELSGRDSKPPIDITINAFGFFSAIVLSGDIGRALATCYVTGDYVVSDLRAFLSLLKSPIPHDINQPEALVTKTRRYLSQHTIPDTTFSSLGTLDYNMTYHDAYTIISELVLERLTSYWFDGTASFTWNPFRLHERMRVYAQDVKTGVLKEVCEVDEVMPGRNERSRFLELYRAAAGAGVVRDLSVGGVCESAAAI
ncbi:hypothetical protein SmJEL517_g01180 [Synchytrium microbalum]|uniref:DUF1365-domain-containing protein n=1 Tax=Synchytrium microbalum TaxID=1806994 RepID=A0A507CAS5_9FUNG|nr:uncharacterized protein SmJEL517_g01180 [Synchytrium microbalum]TPX36722.1 hypothetical protein SmJEL517_g01180 [Synchytrium microbalum]